MTGPGVEEARRMTGDRHVRLETGGCPSTTFGRNGAGAEVSKLYLKSTSRASLT